MDFVGVHVGDVQESAKESNFSNDRISDEEHEEEQVFSGTKMFHHQNYYSWI